MMLPKTKHPVELLRDAKGIYGVGAVNGVVEDDCRRPADLILRPDRLSESNTRCCSVQQMIIGGFRHGMFAHVSEEQLRQVIHHDLLRRAGLAWPPLQFPDRYWSSDPRQQVHNRKVYHGLRLGSLSIINRLIRQALEEAADQKAVTLARRFRFRHRYAIYGATALSPRSLQITAAFPALSLAIFAQNSSGATGSVNEAARLVDVGAPLKKIAELMRVPMALRKIKPGAADLALSLVNALDDQRLVHTYMPDALPKMKLWLRSIKLAEEFGPEFVEWTAKHALEIGRAPNEVINFLSDLTDWVRACHRASVPRHILKAIVGVEGFRQQGEQFVVRRFSPDMSLATVTRLSGDWHEAVAANMSGPNSEFPEPWCPAGGSGGFDIVPITGNADLYREGALLHHCVGTYANKVYRGECYFFSVRKNKERVATLELRESGIRAAIGQLRGACNSQAPKEVLCAVKSWLRSQQEFRLPPKEPERRSFIGGTEQLDDDFPF